MQTAPSTPGFAVTGFNTGPARGFHVTFENGWTVSVQFGAGSYSANYDLNFDSPKTPRSATAEVAAWPATGDMIEMPGGDTVAGWQTPEQVLALLVETAARPAAQIEAA